MTSPGSSLVLIGPMGAGKTSIGKKVAKSLGVGFYDSDVAVVREHGPIEAIFAEHGEPRFRALERAAVVAGLQTGGVVSLGGGAVLDLATQQDLAHHRVVLLTVEPRVVAGRLRDTTRPLLQDEDAMTRWSAILAERLPIYQRLADVSFDTSSGPIAQIADAVADWARTHEGSPA